MTRNRKLALALVFLGISVCMVLNAFLGGRRSAPTDAIPPVLIEDMELDRPPVPGVDLLARHGSHDPSQSFPEVFHPAREREER